MTGFGTQTTFLVCQDGASSVSDVCPSGQQPVPVEAILITPAEAEQLYQLTQPFDAALAAQYFAFAFATTVAMYLLAFGAGLVIKMVKQA